MSGMNEGLDRLSDAIKSLKKPSYRKGRKVMGATHDYETVLKKATDLGSSDVLVGESGGLSAVYNNGGESDLCFGSIYIETEHGVLYLDPDDEVAVLNE